MSLNLNGNKVANQTSDDADGSGKKCPTSPFECEARFRKTWI
jgi:hypothetical protein